MKKNYLFALIVFPFFAISQVTPIPITSDLTADLTGYSGATEFVGQAEYFIYLSADNTLDKPIFLIDGFDPGDSRNIDVLYSSLDYTGNPNFTNLGDELRAEGFDIVVVNFPTYTNSGGTEVDGGADFIERNALTLVKIIETINTDKAANTPEQNVIIGPSMGGLISRYALNYMENNMLDADTRLWISFDAPHLGANVPIGLQHQFNYLANNSLSPVAEVQPIIDDVLNSPAARQLLVDHFLAHLDSSGDGVTFDPALTLPIADTYRTQFETNINSLDGDANTIDFPQNVRKVSVVNGSGIGANYNAIDGTPVTPGFEIVNTTLPVDLGFLGTINVDININMTPNSGSSQQVSSFFTTVIFIGTVQSIASSGTTNFDGIDAAPGGLFDLTGLASDLPTTGVAADFLNALTIDKFSFIPTVSALALEITDEGNNADNINWYHDINLTSGRATTNNTPFDNTFLPDANEDHVAVTEANAAFMLSEIRGTALSTSETNTRVIKLAKNPVTNELILQSNSNENVSLSIIDFTGKTVFKTNTFLGNRTIIPISLDSGFYILKVLGENNTRFTTKFIVNK
ncbi:putative secreted protein (Por secretion system target) [Winogradskyella wandonensis]|uniref:Putative secreted protein (Por secretion system target) n=1 Tax=Winogradskyella wandonensis TaxID=1442586 RepID=A0A4R1KS05_9FLAO|nr:T9SS type A sorting domain-containing protein [Winogradskyella wandonensis]TCK67363.1 putative secreted protein (Por secretion system target) [Winogradskyella wandonensis]